MLSRASLRPLLLAVVLLVAGCAAPTTGPAADSSGDASGAFADPRTDQIGWEAGYWHNESIDVDQSDGLSDAELDAYVGRAMARVEYLREREFKREVPVSVISRAEYQNRTAGAAQNSSRTEFAAWNNQVWEALFITGENRDVQSAISDTRGSSVAGFYSPADDEIKIITETPDEPVINNATLVHELVHGLQDQYVDLTDRAYRGQTQDGDLAIDGLIEGEAQYIERLYSERCGAEWECVATPEQARSSGTPPNLGILLTVYQPYSDGPGYVRSLIDAGGWDAVASEFDDLPQSSEQIIHHTDEEPVSIAFRDRSRNGWSTFETQGQGGSDTVGEASMYAMFWYQARTHGADTIDPRSLTDTDGRYDAYNYESTPSAGWANDRIFPYYNGTGADAAYGYVWVTEWDTEADAREFQRAHRSILAAHNATARGDGVYVVDDGPYADAFRVTRQGTRVTIVNGPTPAALDDIRPR